MKKSEIHNKAKEFEGELFAFLSALGVAGYFLINRYIYTEYHPTSLSYTSTFVLIAGGYGLLSFIIRRLVAHKITKAINTPQLMLVGLVAGTAIGLTVVGQKYTLAGNAAILTTLTVITTVVFSRIFLKQSFKRSNLPWIILMFAGVYMAVIGFRFFHPHLGDWFILGATIFFGLSNTLTRIAMNENSPGVVRDYRFMTAGSIFGLLILLHPSVSFVHTAGIYPYVSALFFWLGILFFNKAVKLIGPSHTIVINNSQIVLTMLLSIPLLSEHLTLSKGVGAACVLLAIQKISSRK